MGEGPGDEGGTGDGVMGQGDRGMGGWAWEMKGMDHVSSGRQGCAGERSPWSRPLLGSLSQWACPRPLLQPLHKLYSDTPDIC